MREASRFGVPSLLTRATGDVSNVQVLLFATLAIAITAPFMLVGAAMPWLSLIRGWRLALSSSSPASSCRWGWACSSGS